MKVSAVDKVRETLTSLMRKHVRKDVDLLYTEYQP